MAAITTATARKKRNNLASKYAKYTMTASKTLVEGEIIMLTIATGLALNGADTAACVGVGVCANSIASAASGTYICEVEYDHEELFATAVDCTALVGAPAVISDNNTVTSVANGANDVKIGTFTEIVSTSLAWVAVRRPTTL